MRVHLEIFRFVVLVLNQIGNVEAQLGQRGVVERCFGSTFNGALGPKLAQVGGDGGPRFNSFL